MTQEKVNPQQKLIENLTQPEQEWIAAFGQTVRTLMDKEVQQANLPNELWQFSPEDEIRLDLAPAPLQPTFMESWEDFKRRFRSPGYRAEIFFKSLKNPANELYIFSTVDDLRAGIYQVRDISVEGIDPPLILDVTPDTVEAKAKEYELDGEGILALTKVLVGAFSSETVDEAAATKASLWLGAKKLHQLSILHLLATNKDVFLDLFNPEQMRTFETSRLLTNTEMEDWRTSVKGLFRQPQRSLTIPYFGFGKVCRTSTFKANFSLATGQESLTVTDTQSSDENYEYYPLQVTRNGKNKGWIIAELDINRYSSGLRMPVRFVNGNMEKFALDRVNMIGQVFN